MKYFKDPPAVAVQVEIARRNLLPEYRKAMSRKRIRSFADIEKYGLRLEKENDFERHYVPPPTVEKVRIKDVAFKGQTKSAAKVEEAATKESEKKKNKKKKSKANTSDGSPAGEIQGEVEATGGGNQYQGSGFQKQGGSLSQTQAPTRPYSGNQAGDGRGQSRLGNSATTVMQGRGSQAPNRADEVCFYCKEPGHRIAFCPKNNCHNCGQQGHRRANCPNAAAPQQQRPQQIRSQPTQQSAPQQMCQVCGRVGNPFWNCPNCEEVRKMLGNARRGQ